MNKPDTFYFYFQHNNMAKKKKKQAGKQDDTSTPKNKGPRDNRVQMGDLYAEEPTPELSPGLAEAIDAAFDEDFVGEITNQVKAEIDVETTNKTAAALSGALSQQSKSGTAPLKTLLRGGGSMIVAIVLMTLLAAVLGWATFVENAYGPNVSRFVVYRAWWFDVLLALLGVNVLCSMLARLPWRRGHVPFVISHVGILILLIGCFVTSQYGIEAQLTVYEGDLGRFSQKNAGDEIGIEIIDFRKTDDEKQIDSRTQTDSSSSAETSASFESVHERWTRERLASQHDRTRIKPAGTRLQPELDVLGLNERLRFPVTLGPINWQDYEAENWFAPDRKFAHSLYFPLQTVRRSKGLVYDKDGIRVELLDYMADSRMKPAQQLKLRVQSINAMSDPVSQTVADSQASNANPVSDDVATSDRASSENATSGDDPVSAEREIDMSTATTHELSLGVATDRSRNQDMYLVALPYERISYRLAKSNAETKAFVEMANQTATGIWGTLVLRVGGQTHLFSVDELIKRQTQFGRSVNVAQAQQKAAEQAAISLRLQLLAPDEEIDADKIKKQLADKESELEELKTKLGELNEQIRMKIGETGLSLEMTVFRPDYLQMILVVTSEDETPYILALSADQPLASTVPDLLGIQIMHIFDPHAAKDDPMGQTSAMAIDRALKPRLDLLQGRDRKLYYRFWDGRKYSQAGEMPTDQSVTSLIGDDGSTLNVAVEAYEPHDYPGLKLVAEPYKKPESQGGMPIVSCVKVRVRIDGVGDETYWLQKTPYLVAATHLQEHRIGYVSGQNRTVAVTFPMAWLDLGFAIFLHKFERALEPGIGMPSHYASLVSVYPIDDQKADTTDLEPLHDHVLIRMNQPGMFTDPQSGRKYRVFQSSYQGPYHPGMQRYEYETDMGGYTIDREPRPRESVYASTLAVNYDPGRGLKYLGCLMIVLGSLALFYTKKVRRKTGLTQLESMHGEHMTDGTEADEMDRRNVLQSSISKRVLFGHVMFVAIGVIVAFSVAANAQDNVSPEVATEPQTEVQTEPQAESPPAMQEASSEETPAETASEEDTPKEGTPKEDGEKQVVEELSTAEQSDNRESLPPTEPQPVDVDSAVQNDIATQAATVAPPMPETFDVSQMRVSSNVIDWRAWEELPVFYEGRVMPLATFARIVVTKVCGQSEPTFVLDEDVISAAERQELLGERDAARIRAKFANGPRRYRNSELVFSWLVEPEVWEYIPFLAAKNKDLRLAIEAKTDSSRFDGPKHVSPYQIKTQAQELQRIIDQWQKLAAEKLGDFELEKIGEEGLDSLRKSGPAAVELQNSYLTYRMLTNEANALPEYQLYLMFVQADRQMQNAYRMQLTLERLPVDFEKLGHAIPFSERNELGLLCQEVNDLLTNFQRAMRDNAAKEAVSARTLEAIFEKLLNAFDERLPEVERFRDAMFALDPRDVPREAGLREGVIRMLRNQSEQLCYSMHQSRQWCEAAYLAIYDSGSQRGRSSTMQIFPALVAESIKADRSYPVLSFDNEHSETGRMPTWLTLHTFLFGSDAMIRRFAIPGLPENTAAESDAMAQNMRLPDYDGTMLTLFARTTKEGNPHRVIRKSFYEMAAAYLALECYDLYVTDDAKSEQSRKDSCADHIERFNRASLAFVSNLRANAEAVTELRRNLVPMELRDNDLLLKTAYPTRKLMRAEYHYERLRPFYLMWVTSAAALALLLISAIVSLFDRKRRRVEAFFFWAGFAVLIMSEIVTLVGACYRAYITGWAPVTNMFETIVLMAFSVVVIGIWYAFQPLFGERLMRAWRVAALPKGMPKSLRADDRRFFKLQVIAFVPRLILSVVVLYYVMLLSYGEAEDGRLTWQVVQNALAMNDPIDMGVVAVSIALITWLVPRALMTVVMFPFVGKADAPDTQKSVSDNNTARVSLWHTLLNRKLFLIVGATLALAAGLAAYFGNATFSPNIRPLMAVLRSNFWLTVHVFAIIIGYAAGAIAWLLAVIACWHCIVGRWHSKRMPDGKYVPQIPVSAEAVMPYIINMLRWTMLLIAVGTMLGARWADYSWGRFWSWDPKEVWALVTLLFYLIVLHGRAARYYGHFGTMLGALFGAIAIIMTWYGANVIFKGSRHAYGGADTSFETKVLLIFIAVNLVWGFLAMLRYMVQKIDAETRTYINRK